MRHLLLVIALFVAPSTLAAPTTYRAERDGWAVQFPDGWGAREANGVVVAGHNTEAGLLVVGFEAGATHETLSANAARGIAADGAVLRLRAPARQVPLRHHGAGANVTAVAAEFDGNAADGTVLSASALAVVGPRGAVTVLGVTSPAQLGALMTRVLAVASSVSFFAPSKAPPEAATAGAAALRGSLCAYSGGSTMSTTTRANFDGAGHVSLGSESAMGGSLVDSGGNETGRYVGGTGNQYDGGTRGSYRIVGNAVEVQWAAGETTRCTVNMRQASGQISELMCDGRLFAAGLCE